MGGGGGLGGLGCFEDNALPLPLGLIFSGLPFFLPGRGGLCAENADVEVGVDMDAMGVPGEVERELGDDRKGSTEAIEESRSLDGTFDCEPVNNIWYV